MLDLKRAREFIRCQNERPRPLRTQSQRRACLPHALPLIGIHPTRLPIVELPNIQGMILMRYQAWTDSVVLVSPTSHEKRKRKRATKKHKMRKKYFEENARPLLEEIFPVPFAFLRLLNEMVADGVVSEFGVGLHIHFVEDATAIRADRFIAE